LPEHFNPNTACPVRFDSIFRKKSVEKLMADAYAGENESHRLAKTLNATDLTLFGIAAIIGGGVFSTIGRAAFDGGPAISLLYLGFAITCIFSAYCYARFASTVPVSGSAYTYAYTTLGEVVAWILGWNLVLEYAISNVTVAISWSDYFTNLLEGFGIKIPAFLTTGYFTALSGYEEASQMSNNLPESLKELQILWETAPQIGGIRFIIDLPALLITCAITWLVFVGIRESKNINNFLVIFKLLAILLVVVAGCFFIKPENWLPFAPEGIGGVMKGLAAVSFAYIGFDSISTTAEECKNPQTDIPKAMMNALLICTILYVATVLVMTGMVNYKELKVGDPLAYIFQKVNMNIIAGIVSVGAVIATTSALLAYQIGQPRIWMVMSRDGLLPRIFGSIHPRFKTPSFATIMTGVVVGVPALVLDQAYVTDLTAIGTLFAFTLVCGGVLVLDKRQVQSKFKIPYVNGKWVVPVLQVVAVGVLWRYFPATLQNWQTELTGGENWSDVWLKIGFFLFWTWLSYLTFRKNLSLIPVVGVLVNLYLMTELGTTNWIRFLVWCGVGMAIYFGYGYRKSKLSPLAPKGGKLPGT
jgi:basic amino acid/polyamine antiporter, APA family